MKDHAKRGRRAAADVACHQGAEGRRASPRIERPRPNWTEYMSGEAANVLGPMYVDLRKRVFAEEKPRGAIAEAYLDGWCMNHATGVALLQHGAAFQKTRITEGVERALRPFFPMDGERARLARSLVSGDDDATRKVEALIPLNDLRDASYGEIVVSHCGELEALSRIQRQAFRRRDQDLQEFRRLQAHGAHADEGQS